VDVAQYLAVQRVVHTAGRALVAEVDTERLYVLSLGSRQGNRHVHWHLVPLPPGVPYEQQQVTALAPERGYVDIPDQAQADLATRLRARIAMDPAAGSLPWHIRHGQLVPTAPVERSGSDSCSAHSRAGRTVWIGRLAQAQVDDPADEEELLVHRVNMP
jgi:hypothetical protein